MKRLLLIPALLLGATSLAMAEENRYEITPIIGLTIPENNLRLADDVHGTYGLEAQYNIPDSKFSPELSAFISPSVNYVNSIVATNIFNVALNGVYTFDPIEVVTPFIKAGVGYELSSLATKYNPDAFFVDAGAGLKVPFSDDISLKLEVIYMLKDLAGNLNSNLMTMAGINFAFNLGEQKAVPTEMQTEEAVVVEETIVEEVAAAAVVAAAVAEEVKAEEAVAQVLDSDNDGIINSLDECPNTPSNVVQVDPKGCADLVYLRVDFKFDSAEINGDNNKHIEQFSGFMKDHDDYDAQLIGHTDSTGAKAYNQKLSERRAKSVKNILVKDGIDANRLTAIGKGDTEPMASNKTSEGRAKNRIVEAKIIKK